MGRPQQRKGRRGEINTALEAEEFGLRTRVHGQYERLDISIEGDMYEVKTCERLGMRAVTDALRAEDPDAPNAPKPRGVIHKFSREPRTITTDFRDWCEDQQELKELRKKCQNPVGLTDEGRKLIEFLLEKETECHTPQHMDRADSQ